MTLRRMGALRTQGGRRAASAAVATLAITCGAFVACGGFSGNEPLVDAGAPEASSNLPDAAAVVDATTSIDAPGPTSDAGGPATDAGATCGVRRVLTQSGLSGLVRYATSLYIADPTSVRSCVLPDCNSVSPLSTSEHDVQSLAVGAGYVFWLGLPDDGGTPRALRRVLTTGGTVERVVLTDPSVNRVQITSGTTPQLTLMGAHLYRASPTASPIPNNDFVSFFYTNADVALTAVENTVFYQNRTFGAGAGSGVFACPEGQGCTSSQPLIAHTVPVQSIHADAQHVYFASGPTVHRVERAGLPDGGVSADGGVAPSPVFVTASGFVRYLEASDAKHLVVATTSNGIGQIQFIPKAGGDAVVCPTPLAEPQAFASDANEVFVADATGVVAVHR